MIRNSGPHTYVTSQDQNGSHLLLGRLVGYLVLLHVASARSLSLR
jgi:hypothetical protein